MIQLIRGFKDILPGEVEVWQFIEKTAVSLFEDFGYREIRIPILEHTELFARSIGEETDIVEKEMYTFPDRNGELITLRPEGTASIVRAYIQHKLYASEPVRKYYMIGPMFRRERPQKGRYRQFYQIDAEIFGVESPYADAEMIFLLITLLERLSVPDTEAHINSLGCPACRPVYKEALSAFISERAGRLCTDCIRRSARNPLRVLDCKVPDCREAMTDAPALLDSLCEACRSHFQTVRDTLEALSVRFTVNKRLVRGLDYYTRTAFEILTRSLGAQSAVAGGGRYDGLIGALGGPETPAIGFAIGFDRLAEIAAPVLGDLVPRPDLFIAPLGEKSREKAFSWSCALGLLGVRVEIDLSGRSLKSLMKRADRLGARHVLIVGENELAEGSVLLRDMISKEQTSIPVPEFIGEARKIFGK
jgi:histidyl-tRNA synthetase